MWCIQDKFFLSTVYPQWSCFISLRFHLFLWIGNFHKFIRKARWDAVGENTERMATQNTIGIQYIFNEWTHSHAFFSVRIYILKFIHMLLQCSQTLTCVLIPYKHENFLLSFTGNILHLKEICFCIVWRIHAFIVSLTASHLLKKGLR